MFLATLHKRNVSSSHVALVLDPFAGLLFHVLENVDHVVDMVDLHHVTECFQKHVFCVGLRSPLLVHNHNHPHLEERMF